MREPPKKCNELLMQHASTISANFNTKHLGQFRIDGK